MLRSACAGRCVVASSLRHQKGLSVAGAAERGRRAAFFSSVSLGNAGGSGTESSSGSKRRSVAPVNLLGATTSHPDDLSIMIFGSSTDVGKTIISAGLCLSALRKQRKVCYIKPVQTGELDEYFIQFYTNPRGINDIFVRTLQHWQVEMAPPLAAQYDPNDSQAMSDDDLLNSLQREMKAFVDSARSNPNDQAKRLFTVVETFGGVLSPGPNQTLQADLYRSLRLPVILVGDSRYGGISSTLSAYESLRLRGYNIYAMVLIDRADPDAPDNATLIQDQINHTYNGSNNGKSGGPLKVFTLSPMPSSQKTLLHPWFQQNESSFNELLDHIIANEVLEYQGYNRLLESGQKYLWWNKKEASGKKKVDFVESAYGDHYRLFSMEEEEEVKSLERPVLTTMFDATNTLHCQSIGHGNPYMSLVIGEACGKFGNLLPFESNQVVHPPLVELSEYLITTGPGKGWAKRVFFAEDTQHGLQEAITMAKNMTKQKSVLDQSDKCQVILTSNPNHSTIAKQEGLEAMMIPMPSVAFVRGKLSFRTSPIFNSGMSKIAIEDWRQAGRAEQGIVTNLSQLLDLKHRLSPSSASKLTQLYQQEIQSFISHVKQQDNKEVQALLIEPLMICKEDITFVDPLYQKLLIQACKEHDIPVIFDETHTGMYRLGPASAWSLLQESPDIACFGKSLAGGYCPISVILTTEDVYASNGESFSSRARKDGFASNPIACSAALEAFRLIEQSPSFDPQLGVVKDAFNEEDVKNLSKLPGITSTAAFGHVFAVQLTPFPQSNTISPEGTSTNHSKAVESSEESFTTLMTSLLRKERVFATVSGKNRSMYLMANPLSTDYDKQRLLRVTRRSVTKAYYMRPQPQVQPPPSSP